MVGSLEITDDIEEGRSFDRASGVLGMVVAGTAGYLIATAAGALANEGGAADFSPDFFNVATALMAGAAVMPMRCSERSVSQRGCENKAAIIGGLLGAAAGIFAGKDVTDPNDGSRFLRGGAGDVVDSNIGAEDAQKAVLGAFTGAVVGKALASGFGCRDR